MYQDWILESGESISEFDNIFLTTEVSQRLMLVNEEKVLISDQNVVEKEFIDVQKEPQMRNTASTYSTTIKKEKFTYKNFNDVKDRTSLSKQSLRTLGFTLTTERVNYQTIIKVNQEPIHPDRTIYSDTDIIKLFLILIDAAK